MTFYYQQIIKLRNEVYPKDYLSDQLVKAKKFIDTHFPERISLSDMASKAFLSKFHFVRLYKKNYGRTPFQYLTEVRIARAKKLLKEGKTVSETCTSVGFDSVTSFTGLFKKITGTTPFAFQQRNFTKKQY